MDLGAKFKTSVWL